MLHECKVQCHTIDPTKLESMGMDDEGKWLPFILDMDVVHAAKLTTDDVSSSTYNCTTIFCKGGDSFIIDTPYREFFDLFREYIKSISFPFGDEPGGDNSPNELDL